MTATRGNPTESLKLVARSEMATVNHPFPTGFAMDWFRGKFTGKPHL